MNDLIPAEFPIGCADTGEGRPVVLLHCSGADRNAWTRMMAAWSQMADVPPLRILRPELFGCGETGKWPGGKQIALDDVVRLVATALSGLDEPFDLVGHSFGGAVALQFARVMPERVRTLTLIEPAAFFLLKDTDVVADMLFGQIAKVALAIQMGAAIDTEQSRRAAMACFVDYWNGPGKWDSLPPQVRQSMESLADAIGLDFTALFAEPTRIADCRDIGMPTLVINGLQSPQPVQRIAAMLERAIPSVERLCIDDAGHMMTLTHAAQIADVIARFQLNGKELPAGTRPESADSYKRHQRPVPAPAAI